MGLQADHNTDSNWLPLALGWPRIPPNGLLVAQFLGDLQDSRSRFDADRRVIGQLLDTVAIESFSLSAIAFCRMEPIYP